MSVSAESKPSDTESTMLEQAVAFVVVLLSALVALALWSTFGLALWLLAVLRVTATAAYALLIAMFSGEAAYPKERVVFVATLWLRGFRSIYRMLTEKTGPIDPAVYATNWQIMKSELFGFFMTLVLIGILLVIIYWTVFIQILIAIQDAAF